MSALPVSVLITHVGAHALVWAASSPTPTPTGTLPGGRLGPFIPQENVPNQDGAGWIAFVIVVAMIIVSIGLFKAMSGSLRRARRNLGADPLPMPPGTHLASRVPVRPPVAAPTVPTVPTMPAVPFDSGIPPAPPATPAN